MPFNQNKPLEGSALGRKCATMRIASGQIRSQIGPGLTSLPEIKDQNRQKSSSYPDAEKNGSQRRTPMNPGPTYQRCHSGTPDHKI
jgi:hypothetical protein